MSKKGETIEIVIKSVYLQITDLYTVVVARERVQRPSEQASDIFNTAYLWEYGAKP